jgi:hypothetical protein
MKIAGYILAICGIIILLINAYLYLTHAHEKYPYLVIVGILLAGFGGRMIRKNLNPLNNILS